MLSGAVHIGEGLFVKQAGQPALEAPPTVISIFLGQQLTELLQRPR